jgi:UDP-3-O-[3-hydroxymyristoyl] N-acetylglucosamine deacetylase
MKPVVLEGAGLFTGRHAVVRLSRAPGPIRLAAGGREAPLAAFVADARGRTSSLEHGGFRLSCVEHLFSAVAALRVRRDLRVEVDGDELPLLDGGAAAWVRALRSLEIPAAPAALRVVREGTLRSSGSAYHFLPAPDAHGMPGAPGACEVHLETDDARLATTAAWEGDADDFARRIAPARTFVAERELACMLAEGYRATVDPESVVVLGDAMVHAAGRPFEADEPARHKLLDLIGDLALHGGPPIGRVVAHRPGHAATHAIAAQAFACGILAATP